MKDYYSVQEFSQLSGVDASTLRYWDDICLFSPIKRNPENNYRYYSLAQITALNFVTTLRDLEIPLKTIADLRKERDPENLLNLLEKKEREMDMELRTLRLRSSIIHTRQELIRYGLKVDDTRLGVTHKEARALILWPRNEYQEGDTFIEPLAAFVNQTGERFINLSFPIGGYWDSMETFSEAPSRPDHFISIDPVGTHIQKAGNYLTGFARGNYAEFGDLPRRMVAYAAEKSLNLTGPVYTMYLLDEICTQEPLQYLSQCYVAVSRSRRRQTKPGGQNQEAKKQNTI